MAALSVMEDSVSMKTCTGERLVATSHQSFASVHLVHFETFGLAIAYLSKRGDCVVLTETNAQPIMFSEFEPKTAPSRKIYIEVHNFALISLHNVRISYGRLYSLIIQHLQPAYHSDNLGIAPLGPLTKSKTENNYNTIIELSQL